MPQEPIVFAYLDEPPFCWPGREGVAEGSDVELIAAALRGLGISAFEQRLTSFAELLPGLVAGRWTITTPLFISPERQKIVDFSRPVWALADGLLVRAPDREWLSSYRAVARAGARLVAVAGQVQEETGRKAGIAPERLLCVATQEEAVEAVRAGRADAYASVAMAHRGYLARKPDPELAVVAGGEGSAQPAAGAFAFTKHSSALRRRVDEALAGLIGSDWHRAMMVRHGFAAGDYEPAP